MSTAPGQIWGDTGVIWGDVLEIRGRCTGRYRGDIGHGTSPLAADRRVHHLARVRVRGRGRVRVRVRGRGRGRGRARFEI